MVSYGYAENVNTLNLVIYALCKECKFDEAISMLYRMFKGEITANVVAFNKLIDGACKMGNIDLALKLVKKLAVMSGDCVAPNSVTYNCLINGYCKLERLAIAEVVKKAYIEKAKLLVDALDNDGLLDAITHNTLLNGFCISGKIDEALDLISKMRKNENLVNMVTYNIMINFLCNYGFSQQAREVMKMMTSKGVAPDFITYMTLVIHTAKNCIMEEVIELHDYMVVKGGIPA
ncbi:pentatricopeptide repeat-containing protein At1g11710, mitochondrial-like [Actinidia eriantha]|uniref:pentatricopeptide repeat-containing protein At1g11710, mitochondrial-like n=1 Tax=Actinidia eriantha TaxID=165200 RepID=UPI002584F001|nr:pentatricopeptide repeat-containing protein At1g11710, mitochondrial-like [Actinidia eriantha]